MLYAIYTTFFIEHQSIVAMIGLYVLRNFTLHIVVNNKIVCFNEIYTIYHSKQWYCIVLGITSYSQSY